MKNIIILILSKPEGVQWINSIYKIVFLVTNHALPVIELGMRDLASIIFCVVNIYFVI